MSRFWSELAAKLTPYVPGEQPRGERLVKLNTNENPYDPSPAVLKAIRAIQTDALRRYPDPDSGDLRRTIAQRAGLRSQQVFLGNGSDEVLAHTFQALLKHDAPLLFPDISYSFYPVWCDLYELRHRSIPLDENFRINVTDYSVPNSGIIIPNPNAPTGILLSLGEIRLLLDNNPDSVVVIDEAYIDFGGESAVGLIPSYDNLLVIQTLSKSRSLAGLRVGAALGSEELIEGLVRVKDSFNSYPLDVVAQHAAQASLEDEDYFRSCCARVVATRERLTRRLTELGFEVLPSAANFLFVRHPEQRAEELFTALRQRGVIVRYFNKPRIDQFLRISIGTESDTDILLGVLSKLLRDS